MGRVVKRATSRRRSSRAAGSQKKAKRGLATGSAKKRATRKVAKAASKKTTTKTAQKMSQKTPKRTAKKATKKTASKARKVKSGGKATPRASAKKRGGARGSERGGRAVKSTNRTATAKSTKKTKGAKSVSRRATAKKAITKSGTTPAKTGTKRRPSKANRAAAPSATSQDPIQFSEETRRLPKTALTAKQLDEFRQLLLKKRRELIGDVRHLQQDAFPKSRTSGEPSPMPIHMADLGSDNWEHEFTLGLIENEQGRIRMIDSALIRVAQKTYGVCLATHKRIGVARLRAKPWAKYCIEYARACEEGRVP